jgi:pimeloyl-ACP methyl ester carboxylesterase
MLLLDFLLSLLAVVGVAAIVLAVLLSRPLKPPPPLASVLDGALQIDPDGVPELTRFQARDGTWLAYRRYPAANGSATRVALLAHGSAGASAQMNAIARGLANAGIEAVAVDFRGHGASGTRGDVAYSGQLYDDLADLIEELRRRNPEAKLAFVGHSSGGGYGLSVASGALGERFERFVLLAPYLGYRAPTNRPSQGAGQWAAADVPRIIAISILKRFGIDWPQALPVIAFAVGPGARKFVTDEYTFRLMTSYAAPDDWEGAFRRAKAPVAVIAGEDDELMDAPAYQRALPPLGALLTLLPGLDHMGLWWRPEAIKAIVSALNA